MTSTFHGLEVGKRSLYTQQTALTTTGNNISNANTPGYSRQRVDMHATSSIPYPYQTGSSSSQLGTGVSVESIERVRSEYLDSQYRERNGQLGADSTKLETLQQIEEMTREPGNGLSASLDRFFSAWEDLASNPDSLAARAVLVERSDELLSQGKTLNDGLASLSESLNDQMTAVNNQINAISSQIDSLNKEIALKPEANELKDRRDLLMDEMSGLNAQNTGKLEGLKQSLSEVNNFQSDLNEVFNQLINGSGMNNVMTSGFSLIKDANGTMQQGKAMFDTSGTGATFLEKVSVNQEVKANPATIAASSTNLAVSNGDIATKISDLKNETLSFDVAGSNVKAEASVSDFYGMLISKIGAKSQATERSVESHQAVLKSIDQNRMSVSGVSLDEEMSNLIQFQHAYNAAARYVSTTDELLDVIINRMGV
ncbi:flagellar hook-associated protein FlgK [Pseudalkalibacillus hwajinpoensis]|uniref:flagellar hook-associated protein FlgK n=1 Tax=Guptibacillus hwajinpoensis TaxID=208199 RepID=UPI001CD5A900|nr:flagellar hook-associated protein FlgK [Pseudalkalibacillus hwajinpoensis]MCA0991129.1 flagellar hook-associated protein FlgK [Pseudalkalibacillus hwajinpoensis]